MALWISNACTGSLDTGCSFEIDTSSNVHFATKLYKSCPGHSGITDLTAHYQAAVDDNKAIGTTLNLISNNYPELTDYHHEYLERIIISVIMKSLYGDPSQRISDWADFYKRIDSENKTQSNEIYKKIKDGEFSYLISPDRKISVSLPNLSDAQKESISNSINSKIGSNKVSIS